MNRRSVITGALCTAGFLASGAVPGAFAQTRARRNSGWITLFDGSNLNEWTPIGDANWRLADGAVVADKGNGFLVSKNTYGDFQIRSEFWVDDAANSGIFIRCSDPLKVTATNSYEVNIFDTRPDPSYATGAIVNVAKPRVPIKAGGRWNNFDITAKGPRMSVTLNGTRTVVDAEDYKHARGWIALQYAAGVVKFSKLQIRPL
jgi:hypothetical protein